MPNAPGPKFPVRSQLQLLLLAEDLFVLRAPVIAGIAQIVIVGKVPFEVLGEIVVGVRRFLIRKPPKTKEGSKDCEKDERGQAVESRFQKGKGAGTIPRSVT